MHVMNAPQTKNQIEHFRWVPFDARCMSSFQLNIKEIERFDFDD